jgi:hypothetical protein
MVGGRRLAHQPCNNNIYATKGLNQKPDSLKELTFVGCHYATDGSQPRLYDPPIVQTSSKPQSGDPMPPHRIGSPTTHGIP